jgi:sugar (pentulose or hexulose) kinase
MTPVWRPHVRAGLYGLSLAHRREHIASAIFEGLTFATRDVAERLRALGLRFDEVLLVGGGARAATWCQLRADVLGLRHRVAANVDGSPLAAAMIAGVAAGAFADLASAAELVGPAAATYEPAPSAALDEAYRRYQALIEGLGRSADV